MSQSALDRSSRAGWLVAAALLFAPNASLAAPLAAEDAPATQPAASKAPAKVVQVKIGGMVREDPPQDNPFAPGAQNFREKLAVLRKLAADPSVQGVRLEVKGAPDFARCIDLQTELRRVKQAGKKIVCYSENLDQRSLIFASLADVLMVPPSGLVILEGLTAELMYLKDLLAKIDVKVHVLHIGEFKTAFEDLSRDSMSDEQRKVLENILGEGYRQMVETIAHNRGLDPKAVEGMFQKVLLDARDAKEGGLVSGVGYEDEFDAAVETLFQGKVTLVEKYGRPAAPDLEKMFSNPFAMFQMLPKLLDPPKKKLPAGPRIAVVYATGPINSGKSTADFSGGVSSMGSETIVEALEAAGNDANVKAVVLRINSPGGSALASDMIWRAIQRVREKKPVVASMGAVAASGGYWIAMGCDRIVAQPSTLTGSIGVVSMLPDLSGTMKKMGIKVEVVGAGPRVNEMAMLKDGPSPFLQDLITRMMQDVYRSFLEKAAAGRKTSPEAIDTVAHGRVWTGREALEVNLIDRLGGFEDAIALACELGGGLDPATVPVAEYPEPPNFFHQIQEAMDEMASLKGFATRALGELGFPEAEAYARSLLVQKPLLDQDRVQAILPFLMRIR